MEDKHKGKRMETQLCSLLPHQICSAAGAIEMMWLKSYIYQSMFGSLNRHKSVYTLHACIRTQLHKAAEESGSHESDNLNKQ